jgi:hypothetical protein
MGAATSQNKAAAPAKKAAPRAAANSSIYERAKMDADQAGSDGPATGSASTDQAQADYNVEYWKYQIESLRHSRKVYAWQHISSIIIFYVVIFLVLVGVVFSWLQFRAASFKGESQELDANLKGVKITSSTLGVVILVLSMCFFFLYLRYVYPVDVTGSAKIAADMQKAAEQ